MKKFRHVLMVFVMIAPLISLAQNVGINTTNPQHPLDVNGRVRIRYNAATPGIWFNKQDNSAEAAMIGNYNDTVLGFYSPAGGWKLLYDHANGNLIMNNSELGVLQSQSSAPMITRAYNSFSSGAYKGAGRFGLFMEPNAIVTGMPDVTGSMHKIVSYGANSTITRTIATFGEDGFVSMPYTVSAGSLYANAIGINVATAGFPLDINGRIRLRHNGIVPGIWFNKQDNSDVAAFFGNYDDTTVGVYNNTVGWKMLVDHKNGNLKLNSSSQGVLLNAADRPLITRGWDAFTSGNYKDAGRWGLFMEVNNLTAGIPNASGSGFKISAYNANSTIGKDLLIANQSGNVQIPGTISINGGSPGDGKVLMSDASGNATWGALTDTIIIPATAFFPESSSETYSTGTFIGRSSTGTSRLVAPTSIPVGSTMVSITYYYYDADASNDLDFRLEGRQITGSLSVIGSGIVSSSGSFAGQRTIAGSVLSPGSNREMSIVVAPKSGQSWSTLLFINAVKIVYTR